VVVDGYTAPVNGGNFVDLVNKGLYNGMNIQRSDGFVVQTVQKRPITLLKEAYYTTKRGLLHY
jgi:cyclophilin family peptidyl-prolyl cis-trans isomerase